jgi:hypothetical protein
LAGKVPLGWAVWWSEEKVNGMGVIGCKAVFLSAEVVRGRQMLTDPL